jgi:hypothetical protein
MEKWGFLLLAALCVVGVVALAIGALLAVGGAGYSTAGGAAGLGIVCLAGAGWMALWPR